MSISTLRRGESSRNSARTNSRNSGALDALLASREAVKSVSFHYQYCGNYGCVAVTGIMLGITSAEKDSNSLIGAQVVAKALNVPLMVVIHEPKDERGLYPVVIELTEPGDVEPTIHEGQTWRKMSEVLRWWQKNHEKTSGDEKCAPPRYEDVWLQRSTRVGAGTLDLSFSNAIREVPGVRHLDVDAAICCSTCNEIEALVEASSDGMSGTQWADRNKATRMTRILAKRIGCYTLLIQHYPNDDNHQYPVTVTGWFADGHVFCEARTISWEELSLNLDSIHCGHADRIGHAHV